MLVNSSKTLYNGGMIFRNSLSKLRFGNPIERLFLFLSLFLLFSLAACSVPPPPDTRSSTGTDLPATRTPTVAPSATFTQEPTPTITPTQTETPIPSATPTATVTPTYAILRGEVLVRSNCRYGPGAPYLYKYGLVPGSNLEVFGRNELGTWILVRAIGGNNPCWVKASLMDVKGDVMSVEPTYIPLPASPYYRPISSVSATRSGEEVTITWNGSRLRPGDETAQAPYLVEAWLCQAGQLIFTPVGSYANSMTLTDESGCSEPSHGRVYIVEKHGYTRPIEVPWPGFD
jgi:hypothetical protein